MRKIKKKLSQADSISAEKLITLRRQQKSLQKQTRKLIFA